MPRFTQTQMAWQIEEGRAIRVQGAPWENIGVLVLGGGLQGTELWLRPQASGRKKGTRSRVARFFQPSQLLPQNHNFWVPVPALTIRALFP